MAVLILGNKFAVHDRLLDRKPFQRLSHRGEFVGPVERLAREQPGFAVLHPRLHAIAVELDFVNPIGAVWCGNAQKRETRQDEVWLGSRTRARDRVCFRLLDLALAGFGLAGAFALLGTLGRFWPCRFRLHQCGLECFRFGGFLRRRGAALRAQTRSILFPRPVAVPYGAFGASNLIHAAPGRGRQVLLLQDVGVLRAASKFVIRLDQEPILARLAGAFVHTHQMPAAVQLGAVEAKLETTLLKGAVRVALGLPGAAVPDHHSPAAIFTLGNGAFELVVFDGMIFDMDGEPLFARNEARAAGHRPAFHYAVELKSQVVMQPRCSVLLDNKSIAAALSGFAPRL